MKRIHRPAGLRERIGVRADAERQADRNRRLSQTRVVCFHAHDARPIAVPFRRGAQYDETVETAGRPSDRFAIGRGVPLIAVMLGLNPYGLMGKGQGLGGCDWKDTDAIAAKAFQLLLKRLADKSRLFECALAAYSESSSWVESAWKVKRLLSCFPDLSANQLDQLLAAYRANPQNKSSFDGMDLLRPLLNRWTGKNWTVINNELALPPPAGRLVPIRKRQRT